MVVLRLCKVNTAAEDWLRPPNTTRHRRKCARHWVYVMGRPLAARRKSLRGYLARRAATSLKKTPPQSRARQPRRRNPQHIPRGLDFVRQHRPRIDSLEQTTDRRSRRCASEKRSPPQHISRKAARSSWSSGSIVQDTHACSKRCTSCSEKGTASFTAGNVHLPWSFHARIKGDESVSNKTVNWNLKAANDMPLRHDTAERRRPRPRLDLQPSTKPTVKSRTWEREGEPARQPWDAQNPIQSRQPPKWRRSVAGALSKNSGRRAASLAVSRDSFRLLSHATALAKPSQIPAERRGSASSKVLEQPSPDRQSTTPEANDTRGMISQTECVDNGNDCACAVDRPGHGRPAR